MEQIICCNTYCIIGVRFTGLIHPGLIGCAPSKELLDKWNAREKELVDTNPNRVPPLANLPNPIGALVGNLQGYTEFLLTYTVLYLCTQLTAFR